MPNTRTDWIPWTGTLHGRFWSTGMSQSPFPAALFFRQLKGSGQLRNGKTTRRWPLQSHSKNVIRLTKARAIACVMEISRKRPDLDPTCTWSLVPTQALHTSSKEDDHSPLVRAIHNPNTCHMRKDHWLHISAHHLAVENRCPRLSLSHHCETWQVASDYGSLWTSPCGWTTPGDHFPKSKMPSPHCCFWSDAALIIAIVAVKIRL